jgi:glyoxylase-like metal-dependent hydrolase (beta-lactamase superfamily II)
MKIIPLSEGWFTVDQTKQFVPFDASVDTLPQRPAGSLLVEIQPFVVVTSQDIILLDAGLGFLTNGQLQLQANLKAVGIDPLRITKVILSHLHKDHIGGIAVQEATGLTAAFPSATYYVQELELNHAMSTIGSSYNAPLLNWLSSYEKTKRLNGSEIIDGYISVALTGGHARFHQAIWIREDEKIIFYGGDEAPQLQQMRHRFVAKYDFDGKRAMALRQQWWQEGETEKWIFLFYHDVKHPTYQFSAAS